MSTVSNLIRRVPPLFADLAKIIAGDIDCSLEILQKYSTDQSPFIVLPQAIIYPKNTVDIKHVLAFAREYRMPVTVYGKGSSDTGGALGEGIILDMSRYFSQIRNINMIENTITVDVGVSIESLLEKLHAWNYDIPLFRKTDSSTLGGLFATKSVLPGSFLHGSIREWVEGLTVVVDNGEEHIIADGITPSGRLLGIYQSIFPLLTKENPTLRAAKPSASDDATGYNLWNTSIGPRQLIDQLAGSEGTLAIITSLTFRIVPYKPYHRTSCIPLTNLKELSTCITLAKTHHAEMLYLYDEVCMELADRYRPATIPFFTDTPYVLLVTHTGSDPQKLNNTVHAFLRKLPVEQHRIKTIESRELISRVSTDSFVVDLFNDYTNTTLAPVTLGNGLIVTDKQLPLLIPKLETYLQNTGKLYSIGGNVGSGHIAITTVFDKRAKHYSEDFLNYLKTLVTIVGEFRGGISAQGGEGLGRTPFISSLYSHQTLEVFQAVKHAWDPLNILNPGKKLGTTTTYLTDHLKAL